MKIAIGSDHLGLELKNIIRDFLREKEINVIGMAIAANKVRGIRAAVCHDLYSAERSRKSNNAQIMAIGALIIGPELAKKLVEAWLNSEFQGGRSERKVKKIMEIEAEGN